MEMKISKYKPKNAPFCADRVRGPRRPQHSEGDDILSDLGSQIGLGSQWALEGSGRGSNMSGGNGGNNGNTLALL